MKVSATSDDKVFDIPVEDMTIKNTVVAIKCPTCKNLSYLIDLDMYGCYACDKLWSVK